MECIQGVHPFTIPVALRELRIRPEVSEQEICFIYSRRTNYFLTQTFKTSSANEKTMCSVVNYLEAAVIKRSTPRHTVKNLQLGRRTKLFHPAIAFGRSSRSC